MAVRKTSDSRIIKFYTQLKRVMWFNFKPKYNFKKKQYIFTSHQKKRIKQLALKEPDENGIEKNTRLYNSVLKVERGDAYFKIINRTKSQLEKLQKLSEYGLFTTNKGFFLMEPDVVSLKVIVEKGRPDKVLIDYVKREELPDAHSTRDIDISYNELFIPIPLAIWQSEDFLDIFVADLRRKYKPETYHLAINGSMGKSAFKMDELAHYIKEYLTVNFEIDKPFVTGLYLIKKPKYKILH